MSYLICEKCGGYYALKEGEEPEDPENLIFWDQENEVFYGFEICECGGSLKYVQNFNSHFDEELDPINEVNICPDCGTKILAEKYCKSCGKIMKNSKNQRNSSSDKFKNVLNKFKMHNDMILRTIAIIMGILIVLIPAFLFTGMNYSLLLLLIGGMVASLISGGKSEDGALNGIIVGIIASLLLLILKGNFIFIDDIFFNVNVLLFEMSGAVLILTIFGLVGGVIGILIRDLLIKTNKS